MNRHLRIFIGIFCWISVVVCVCLAILNGLATPVSADGMFTFGAIAVVMVVLGLLVSRDRTRV